MTTFTRPDHDAVELSCLMCGAAIHRQLWSATDPGDPMVDGFAWHRSRAALYHCSANCIDQSWQEALSLISELKAGLFVVERELRSFDVNFGSKYDLLRMRALALKEIARTNRAINAQN